MFWRTVVRASGDPKFTKDGRWGQMLAMVDGTFRMLSTGASWSGGESNHLFFGKPGKGRFTRLSGISGLDDPGDSMAAALLDFDRDGWMDLALGNISKPRFRLFRNNIRRRLEGGPNGFVALRFVGGNDRSEPAPGWSTRDGVGARVEVELGKGRSIVREYRRNDGFKSQHSGTLLIGIGRADEVDLRITWPSGRRQTVPNVPAGVLVTLYENEKQSPTGKAAVHASYVPKPAESAADNLKILGAHGNRGLTVYMTMSTSCAACRRALPDLKALRQAFKEKELTLVGIPVNGEDSEQTLREFARNERLPYSLQVGLPKGTVRQIRNLVAERLHGDGSSTPASIVADSSGRILAVRWGVPTISELRRLRATRGDR